MGCCESFAKYMLILFNVFVWVAGGTLLGIGIYLRVGGNIEDVVTIADIKLYYAGCYLMIFCGALMFLVGFLGCCGAMTENRCLLGTYFTCLLILFFLEVGLGIWAVVEHDKIDDAVTKGFNKTLTGGDDPNNVAAQSAIAMQRQFKCCGLMNGCKDWADKKTFGCTCKQGEKNCTLATQLGCTVGDAGGGLYIYEEGCYESVVDYVEGHVWTVVGIGLGVGFAEIIGMILAIMVCTMSKRNQYEGMLA